MGNERRGKKNKRIILWSLKPRPSYYNTMRNFSHMNYITFLGLYRKKIHFSLYFYIIKINYHCGQNNSNKNSFIFIYLNDEREIINTKDKIVNLK